MSFIDARPDGEPLSIDSTEDNPIPADFENLTPYHSSSIATRYFCSRCSAHMFFRSNEKSGSAHWSVLTGVLERIDGIVTVSEHIWLSDTLDGGISDHFRAQGSTAIARRRTWQEDVAELPPNWKDSKLEKHTVPNTLPFHCQCKSVSFYLTRATKLLDDHPEAYWLVPGKRPTDPINFIAAHCLCNSCRLTSGGQIQSWVIVPNENIIDSEINRPIDLVNPEKRPKGLKQYESSPGHYRESCKTCGATAFWWRTMKDGESPHMDVALGLVDQVVAGGARAEGWVSWHNKLIFPEFSLSQETVKILEEGLKATSKTA